MKKLKSVGVLSVGKLSAALYAILGLVFGAMLALLSLIIPADVGFPRFLGFGAIILFPLLYGGMGFMFGLLAAFLYNISAKYTGGIEMKIEDIPEINLTSIPNT